MHVCKDCNVELNDKNWRKCWQKEGQIRYRCTPCGQKSDVKSNPTRLYLDGRYIPKGSYIYELLGPGRFKTSDLILAETQLEQQEDGYIYIVVNENAYPGWVKIGMTVNPKKRLGGFQTASPFCDFKMVYTFPVSNRRKAEKQAHKLAKKLCEKHNGNEWFKMSVDLAKEVINGQ